MGIALFITLQFINVIVATLKSISTVSGSKLQAAFMNTLSFTVNVVVVKLLNDYSFPVVIAVTIITNFTGVYLAKYIIEKKKKDRLWNIYAIIKGTLADETEIALRNAELTYTAVQAKNDRVIFNIYAANRAETSVAKSILGDANYSVFETI